jgi:hypothetical protein
LHAHQLPQKNFDSKQQTLRAVTIKQLHDALATSQDDSLVLDGRELTNVGRLLGGWDWGGVGGAGGVARCAACKFTPLARLVAVGVDCCGARPCPILPTSSYSHLPQLTFVAKILSINEGGVTFMLKVDDGTGKVDVKIWINEDGEAQRGRVPPPRGSTTRQPGHTRRAPSFTKPRSSPPPCDADSEVDRQRRAQWRPGMYVRVHGHFSNFGQSQDVLAFNVRLVADHNEVRGPKQAASWLVPGGGAQTPLGWPPVAAARLHRPRRRSSPKLK